MADLDHESRANRLIGAIDGLANLHAAAVPGMMAADPGEISHLLSLLADEARIVAYYEQPSNVTAIRD